MNTRLNLKSSFKLYLVSCCCLSARTCSRTQAVVGARRGFAHRLAGRRRCSDLVLFFVLFRMQHRVPLRMHRQLVIKWLAKCRLDGPCGAQDANCLRTGPLR